jgi:hypothetical protein
MRWWLLLLVLAAELPAVEVILDANCPWIDRDGYTPVILSIRADEPTQVEVRAELDDNEATAVIAVPAGELVRQTLLIPGSLRRWSSSVEITWRAPGRREVRTGASPRGFRDLDVVVVDPEESLALKDYRERLAKELGNPPDSNHYRGSTSGSYNQDRFNRWAFDSLPERWQGWPAWVTVVTTAAGDRRLSDGQRQALAAWTHAGGRLFVADRAQLAAWRGLGARAELLNQSALNTRVRQVWDSLRHEPAAVAVPDTGRVPVYGFVSIAVLFSLVVGPLNFWWCARQGRRHLLLLTTPLLSLAACTVLLVYGLVADGLGTRRLAAQVMILDQQLGRASVWHGLSYFAGLAPGAIGLDPDDRLSVIGKPDDRREEPSVELAWSTVQRATGSWIPARMNRQLAHATVRPERRRLGLAASGAGWQVTNGFDQSLTSLAWQDPQGQPWHLVTELAPGASAPLVRGSSPHGEPPIARLPVAAFLAVQGGAWTARFAAPLVEVPGPEAVDVQPVATWVIGLPFSGLSASGQAASGGF